EELRLGTTPEIVQMIGGGAQRGDELLKIRCLELLGCHLPSSGSGTSRRDAPSRSILAEQVGFRATAGQGSAWGRRAHSAPPGGSRHDRMKSILFSRR